MLRATLLSLLLAFPPMTVFAQTGPANQVVGTWRMVAARIDPDGKNLPAYGEKPNGLLVFTPDMRSDPLSRVLG